MCLAPGIARGYPSSPSKLLRDDSSVLPQVIIDSRSGERLIVVTVGEKDTRASVAAAMKEEIIR